MQRHAFHLKLGCCIVVLRPRSTSKVMSGRSKVEYRAVIRYLYLKGKTGKEIHNELADVYGTFAPSDAQVKFWVRNSNTIEHL